MNQEDIIKMAREAGMQGMLTDVVCTHEELARFAALVAAAEREACAKVCETFYNHEAKDCAAAIRARSKS